MIKRVVAALLILVHHAGSLPAFADDAAPDGTAAIGGIALGSGLLYQGAKDILRSNRGIFAAPKRISVPIETTFEVRTLPPEAKESLARFDHRIERLERAESAMRLMKGDLGTPGSAEAYRKNFQTVLQNLARARAERTALLEKHPAQKETRILGHHIHLEYASDRLPPHLARKLSSRGFALGGLGLWVLETGIVRALGWLNPATKSDPRVHAESASKTLVMESLDSGATAATADHL